MSGSISTGTTYEVFLSFRGQDTRQGFTDVLYHALVDAGIIVFRDNEEIPEGGEIGREILTAIEDSKILVPVFSKGYASSKWCLRELVKMVESKERSPCATKKIVPIFYDVNPDDVQLNTKLYADALSEHLKLQPGSEEVQQWADTLKKVAMIKGLGLKTKGFAEFAKDFARKISIKLKAKQKYMNRSLVRRSLQQNALMRLLDVGPTSRDVRFVWIHGMGGIGKTTLAKVVYNMLCDKFDNCSFLLDVQETSKHKGVEHLQRQLLQDLGVKSVVVKDENDGVGAISEKLKKKKVLIVLDNVYDQDQVGKLAGEAGWFGDGSRIIITSRNKKVSGFEGGKVDILEAEPMNFEESLLLFSRHAFGKDSPSHDFLDISEKVVTVTGGLPLSLEVIGSQLHGCHNHDRWHRVIDSLDKIPPEKVKDQLRISYDALNCQAKKVFLDIACFFINEEKTKPMYMWESCGCDIVADWTVEELINRSLLKINDEGKFWMHDQLRDLGRSIVRDLALEEPWKPSSRIWIPEEALKVLRDAEGKGNVDMLRLSSKEAKFSGIDHGCILTKKELKGFKNLRFLSLQKSKFSGDLQDVLPNLTWFSWQYCSTNSWGTNLCMKNLVVLDLSWSDIRDDWIGWRQIAMCKELKVLDLTGCYNLTKTPDLSECMKLERLVLQNCINLVEIDCSIGKLQRLKYLNATWCECDSLAEIPQELACLDGVEKMVPKVYDHLENLLETFSVLRLPDWIGRLSRIKHLSVCLGMNKLPDSLGDLRSLTRLDLSRSNMVELPQSIGGLIRLEFLSLHFCKKIQQLPDSIGNLISLAELDISWSTVTELPNTIGNLYELKVINMKGSAIAKLPDSVQYLKKLEKLDVEHCCCLQNIPTEFQGI